MSAALPPGVESIYARADSGFYCWEAVEAYENRGCQFIMVARKTARLVEALKAAGVAALATHRCRRPVRVSLSAGGLGPGLPLRGAALREAAGRRKPPTGEQYQLFETPEYTYRVFVTNMKEAVDLLVWFYNQRAGAENLIKEANNDAGLAAHPSARWAMNCNHFQIGDAGLQPELLAAAVQPGRRHDGSGD